MSRSDVPLGIRTHRIVPARVEDDSVIRWRCLDCDSEHPCASGYLDEDCRSSAEQGS